MFNNTRVYEETFNSQDMDCEIINVSKTDSDRIFTLLNELNSQLMLLRNETSSLRQKVFNLKEENQILRGRLDKGSDPVVTGGFRSRDGRRYTEFRDGSKRRRIEHSEIENSAGENNYMFPHSANPSSVNGGNLTYCQIAALNADGFTKVGPRRPLKQRVVVGKKSDSGIFSVPRPIKLFSFYSGRWRNDINNDILFNHVKSLN